MPKGYLFLDLETRSNIDLRTAGVYRYSQSPATSTDDGFELLLFSYIYVTKRGAIRGLWSPLEHPAMPKDLFNLVCSPAVVKVAHNAQFDRVALSRAIWPGRVAKYQ